MVKVFATITIYEDARESDRIFSDKRNSFRGLFDIVNLKSERTGIWYDKNGYTYFSFYVNCERKDSPVVFSILRELGFLVKYV